MNDNQSGLLCALGGWGLAILAGILAAILLMILGDWRFIAAVFAGIVIAVIIGVLMSWFVCVPPPAENANYQSGGSGGSSAGSSTDNSASGQATAGAVAAGAGAAAAATAVAASGDSADAADDGAAEIAKASSTSDAAAPVADSGNASAQEAGDTVGSSSIVKASTPLEGSEELASRKGAWKYEGEPPAKKRRSTKAISVLAAVESSGTLDSSDVDDSASIEAELGTVTPPPSMDKDYDNDGILEGANEGTKPEALDGPRGGKADNLKEIKGIGPKLEVLCNELGFYHFDQIANWTADEVAWVNANLAGFKGRVTRDTWVEQAKILAAGGETEFSKRVDDGSVY